MCRIVLVDGVIAGQTRWAKGPVSTLYLSSKVKLSDIRIGCGRPFNLFPASASSSTKPIDEKPAVPPCHSSEIRDSSDNAQSVVIVSHVLLTKHLLL